MSPIIIPLAGLTKPAAGVTPTNPETAPVAIPTEVDLPSFIYSIKPQVINPAAAEICVVVKGNSAPPTASWLPPLNPNHPNHSKPVPNKICVTLWGGGLLGKDLDFAGGTVVHISSGVSALVLASLIGSRSNHPEGVKPPHNVTQILLGTGLLWFGWFGFNGGSQLAVGGAELPFTTTHISAAAGLIAWGFIEYINEGKSTSVGMATGAVSGLVGVTPAAGFVNPASGMIIGLITSVLCFYSIKLKNKLQFDDSLDTFAVHGVGGTVGAILTGFFASYDLISSHPAGQIFIEKGRIGLVFGQFQAIFIAYGISAIGTLLIALIIKKAGIEFRVSKEEEEKGLDFIEHGEKSYT